MKLNVYRFCALLCLSGVFLFHFWQNLFAVQGGSIAFPKSLWLGLTVFCWLLVPPLMIRHSQDGRAKWVWWIFWLGMLARALVEMWLLYGVQQWRYVYGIAHDLFSAVLLLAGAYWCAGSLKKQSPEIKHMVIMAMMFLCETLFAYYISHFNDHHAHAKLWFIDWQAVHLPNLLFTLGCEIALIYWLWRLDIVVEMKMQDKATTPAVYE